MVEWHHPHNGGEFEQTLGLDEGQGSLACCSPWGCKESDTTAQQQQQVDTQMIERERDRERYRHTPVLKDVNVW